MNDILNPAPTLPVTVQSNAFNLARFSNETATGLGQDTSGSGAFNWALIGDWLNSAGNIVTGVWGSSDKYTAMAYETMYNQEKKTSNLMIGIVVALVLLAFAFLIIKRK
jgi:hypothetical protein